METHIIIHAKKSLLYTKTLHGSRRTQTTCLMSPWAHKDAAETCELIGTFMLSLIASKFQNEVGPYCDDGLAICKVTPKEIEK